jgi:hypothetical protein
MATVLSLSMVVLGQGQVHRSNKPFISSIKFRIAWKEVRAKLSTSPARPCSKVGSEINDLDPTTTIAQKSVSDLL